MITVIGAGYREGDLTVKGLERLLVADKIVVRTDHSAAMQFLSDIGIRYQSLDGLYEDSRDFDELNSRIVEYLLDLHKGGDIVYVVTGSGVSDSVLPMLAESAEISVIAGVDYAVAALAQTGTVGTSFQTVSATDFLAMDSLCLDTRFSLIITDICDRFVAGDVKLKLSSLLGEEREVYYITHTGCSKTPLYSLDRMDEYDDAAMCLVKPIDFLHKSRYTFSDLLQIIYRLRAPDGCKWDREQTHKSIRDNCIEEAYELIEAVNLGDIDKMIEESGDVLLQGLFHCVIAEQDGEYDHNDVLTVLCDKLIKRHTHIFGDVKANTPEEALAAWEAAKAVEKKYDSFSDAVDGIAKTLTPATRALKVQKLAKKAKMDFASIDDVVSKVNEELAEVISAKDENLEKECGDLLFAVVNLLRFLHIDSDLALNGATDKFVRRMKAVETMAQSNGKRMIDYTDEELNDMWEQVKADEDR